MKAINQPSSQIQIDDPVELLVKGNPRKAALVKEWRLKGFSDAIIRIALKTPLVAGIVL